MSKFRLSSKVQNNLQDLVRQLRSLKGSGGFFLVGVSGPLAKKTIKKELSARLKKEFQIKKIRWESKIRDLREFFPLEDPPNTIYIVDVLEKTLMESNGAYAFSLLNMTREFFLKNRKIVIYLLPPDALYKGVQWKAPDFWSFRTASFDFHIDEDYQADLKKKISAELEGYEKDSERILFLEELLAKAAKRKKTDQRFISNILRELGNLYLNTGQVDRALKYYQQSLQMFKELGDKQGEANTLGDIGKASTKLGDTEQAIGHFQQALVLQKELGNKPGLAEDLENMGALLGDLGQTQEALNNFVQAMSIQSELGNKLGLAVDLENIGKIFSDVKETQQALVDNFENALRSNKELANILQVTEILNKKKESYENSLSLNKALDYSNQALRMFRDLGDKYGAVSTLDTIGITYSKLGELEKALTYHQEALELARQLGYKHKEADSLCNIGILYRELGQDEKALTYLHSALTISQNTGNKAQEQWILEEIEKTGQTGLTTQKEHIT